MREVALALVKTWHGTTCLCPKSPCLRVDHHACVALAFQSGGVRVIKAPSRHRPGPESAALRLGFRVLAVGQMRHLAEGLQRRGCEVAVLATGPDAGLHSQTQNQFSGRLTLNLVQFPEVPLEAQVRAVSALGSSHVQTLKTPILQFSAK